MINIKKYIQANWLIFFILLLGLFFRTYKLESLYSWGHDQDLFAWIAKDIMVDRHIRLIGQETSITGVFIGPIFYYLMAIFMVFFNMNPLGAYIPITIISLATIFSIYWVFSNFFGKTVGIIGAFLYAVSPGIILTDRWIVPTQPTNLWVIWYLYTLLSILKSRVPLILLGTLIGLIWHVHVAFIPLLILLPIAWLLSKKDSYRLKINFKHLIIAVLVSMILMSPLFAFEIRHGFQQVKGLIAATYEQKDDLKGFNRLQKVLNISGRSLGGIFLLDKNVSLPSVIFMTLPLIFLGIIIFLYIFKTLMKNQALILSSWIFVNLFAQFISKRSIPEYYFANLFIIFFLIISIIISRLKNLIKTSWIIPSLLGLYLAGSFVWIIKLPDDQGSFLYKRQTIEYIKNHATAQGYSCLAVNFIEGNRGLPNGFRYLFWYFDIKVVTSGNDIPVYNIVTPWDISENEIDAKFGIFGIVNPVLKNTNPKVCTDPSRQLLPLWGFTN